jgi:hypothetical protein
MEVHMNTAEMLYLLRQLDESAGTETQGIWREEFLKEGPGYIKEHIRDIARIGSDTDGLSAQGVHEAIVRYDQHKNVHQVPADDIRLFIRASAVFYMMYFFIKERVS